MFKGLKFLGAAAAAAVLMAAAPAQAAPVIDFGTGGAGNGGNIVSTAGGNLIGTNIPIGAVSFFDTPNFNGVVAGVTGTATASNSATTGLTYGDLDFNTATGSITLNGCIVSLGIGTAGCATPQLLLSGTITGFTNFGSGIFITSGTDTKNAQLLTALGLPSTTPFILGGSFSTATGSTSGNGAAAISTDIRNTAVPEPATMMLLGTGLLAAFRARRKQQA